MTVGGDAGSHLLGLWRQFEAFFKELHDPNPLLWKRLMLLLHANGLKISSLAQENKLTHHKTRQAAWPWCIVMFCAACKSQAKLAKVCEPKAVLWVKVSTLTNKVKMHQRFGALASNTQICGVVNHGFFKPSFKGKNVKCIDAMFCLGGDKNVLRLLWAKWRPCLQLTPMHQKTWTLLNEMADCWLCWSMIWNKTLFVMWIWTNQLTLLKVSLNGTLLTIVSILPLWWRKKARKKKQITLSPALSFPMTAMDHVPHVHPPSPEVLTLTTASGRLMEIHLMWITMVPCLRNIGQWRTCTEEIICMDPTPVMLIAFSSCSHQKCCVTLLPSPMHILSSRTVMKWTMVNWLSCLAHCSWWPIFSRKSPLLHLTKSVWLAIILINFGVVFTFLVSPKSIQWTCHMRTIVGYLWMISFCGSMVTVNQISTHLPSLVLMSTRNVQRVHVSGISACECHGLGFDFTVWHSFAGFLQQLVAFFAVNKELWFKLPTGSLSLDQSILSKFTFVKLLLVFTLFGLINQRDGTAFITNFSWFCSATLLALEQKWWDSLCNHSHTWNHPDSYQIW